MSKYMENIDKIVEMVNEHFEGNVDKALISLNKMQKRNNLLHEEHIRMGRNDKADIVMDKIKYNNEIMDIIKTIKDE